jgi:putative hydrolase of the HAD superfamily
MTEIEIIAFDADDTLWINEPYFQETEKEFCKLLAPYLPEPNISQELFKTEIDNLELYGYGIKGFMLSMVETLLKVAGNQANSQQVQEIIQLGKQLLQKPIELLEGVKEVLEELKGKYLLVVATKGDLLDQERKLEKSELTPYFHHIEIMSNKKASDYAKLFAHLDCEPEQFLMVGNSLKSDILPVLELGAYAVHVPFHTTWAHEELDGEIDNPKFLEAGNITEIIKILS